MPSVRAAPMDLQLLETLKAVVDEGSFSAAGQKLFRSQPAVSLALKRLEEDLGETLIDRSSKAVVLTDAGRAVYEYAQRFEGLEKELRGKLIEFRDRRGPGCGRCGGVARAAARGFYGPGISGHVALLANATAWSPPNWSPYPQQLGKILLREGRRSTASMATTSCGTTRS